MTSSPQASVLTPFRPSSVKPTAESCADAQSLIGPSPAIARLWSQLRLLAPHFRVALLTGEPGCGFEAVAQALHDLSRFAGTPLIRVAAADCERQLRHPGTLFGDNTRGALLLTDIDRLSPGGQQAVLRLLRLRRYRRIALIAFSTADLRALVSAGTLNAELVANISSVRLQIPSLRERTQDLPLLTHSFLQSESVRRNCVLPSLDVSFIAAVADYTWPGNLDQLRGAIAWMMEHCAGPLSVTDLHAAIAEVREPAEPADSPVRMVPLDHVVHEHVRAVLVGCNGNKLRAAEVLGISRSTLYRMLDAASVAGGTSSLALLAS